MSTLMVPILNQTGLVQQVIMDADGLDLWHQGVSSHSADQYLISYSRQWINKCAIFVYLELAISCYKL